MWARWRGYGRELSHFGLCEFPQCANNWIDKVWSAAIIEAGSRGRGMGLPFRGRLRLQGLAAGHFDALAIEPAEVPR